MKTTLRLTIATLSLLAITACGGSDVSNTGDYYEPEATPEVTPDATPTPEVPNSKPYVPLFTLSVDSVKPQEQVVIDLALADPDGDALTTECTAVLTSQAPEFEIVGSLAKLSESQYLFTAPITQTEIGTAVVRCKANDGRDNGLSDVAESGVITIDNYVDVTFPSDNYRNICRIPKTGCKIELTNVDMMRVNIPDPQIYVPDQVRGAFFEVPSTDYIANVDLAIDTTTVKYSLIDANTPSIQITVGTDDLGSGYSLELIPYVAFGTKVTTMGLGWRWQVVALAADGMTKENLFAGNILASGNLSGAPNHVQVTSQDGLVHFTINGFVNTPAIASTNAAGTQLGFSARSAALSFSNAGAVLKP